MVQGGDEYINRYPRKELLQILKNSEYHSEEWEETDEEYEEYGDYNKGHEGTIFTNYI